MKTLYLKVEICKALQDQREEINYYILRDKSYGLCICREHKDNTFKKEEITMENIFSDIEDVKKVIDLLVSQGNDLSQMQYVIEDYKKSTSLNIND